MSGAKIPVIAVVGPTASGKTALAVHLASRLGGEIVGADSMQLYRGFPIASAAPTAEERAAVPYHLAECLDPATPFSVASYVERARTAIAEITERGCRPIVCGGTGLYLDALLGGLNFSEEPPNDCRARLEAEADSLGCAALLERLRAIDPEAASRLHENDRKRILRGLEVYELHGKTPTELNRLSRACPSPYEVLWIGLCSRDRQTLYDRIDRRADAMLEAGLAEEARAARRALGTTAVQAIGHKELYPYLDGEIPLAEAADRLKRATRRYAKRQMTWFRRNDAIHWLYLEDGDPAEAALALAEDFLRETK